MTVVRWIFAVIIVALVGMAAMNSLKPRKVPPVKVQTAKAVKTQITKTVAGAGKLEPLQKINVSSQITGTLLDLQVVIGSEVKKGQYLGKIDASRYEAQVSQQRAQVSSAQSDVNAAKANLDKAKREAERVDQLVERGAAGTSEAEQAHSAVRVAEANLASAESRVTLTTAALNDATKQVEWSVLKSPVDGTVLAVDHRVGERIRGSDFSEDVILVLGSADNMQVRIEVVEHDVVYLQPGQKATIEIDALPDRPLEGHVIDSGRDAIVKNAGTDNEVTTFPVWITLDHPPHEALSGMSAQVTIQTESHGDVVAVPIQAVTARPPLGAHPEPVAERKSEGPSPGPNKKEAGDAGKPGAAASANAGKLEKVVFVVKNGKVERRRVTTAISSETLIEVTSGVDPGEEIVEGPYRTLARELQDGTMVEVGENK